jgi:7-cyano-7-deazaguanine reductase
VPNPQKDALYLARFTAPEFTSLCPVTGQPDFAHLVIDYAPGEWLIESKSFKLYLTSFRNHGAFHEDCTIAIGKKIVARAEPRWRRRTRALRPIAVGGDRHKSVLQPPDKLSPCPTAASPLF